MQRRVIILKRFNIVFLLIDRTKMESINQPTTVNKKGHNRRQSYGKIMPISSILNNLIGPNTNTNRTANEASIEERSPLAHATEAFSLNARVNERSDGDDRQNTRDAMLSFINHEKTDEINRKQPQTHSTAEMDVDKTFLKCINYHRCESEVSDVADIVTADPQSDEEDNIDRLLGNDVNATCLICTNKDVDQRHGPLKFNLMNVLCKKLCDESCNTSTKTCQSIEDIITHNSSISAECESDSTGEGDAKVKTENTVLHRSNSSRQEFLASMLETSNSDGHTNTDNTDDESHVAPLTMENLKQFNDDYFREKLAIAEALANTSMMTSSAAKSRLAARKIEMSLNNPDFVYDPENAEYIPPKELLMYLVR